MKPQAETIFNALLRGERLSPQDSVRRYSVMALAQRVSELRRLGYKINDMFPVKDGRVQKYKVYSMDVPKPASFTRTHTLVREHVRQLNVIDRDVPEEQPGLFA